MSVDSLINYEAVKVHLNENMSLLHCLTLHASQYFNNENFEIAQYDAAMRDYTKASIKISTSLAALNIGQNIIFSSALTGMMYLAAQGVIKGAFTRQPSPRRQADAAALLRNDDRRRSRHGQPARIPALVAAELPRCVHLSRPGPAH